MKCPSCSGSLEEGKASYVVTRHGYHLIIDDVPAFICSQCEEPLFTEEAVRLVQNMIRALDEQQRELSALALLA